MKKIDLIKDFIISILIIICIVLIISVIFYDKISIGKVIPESEDYLLTEEMQADLNQAISDEQEEEVVTKYYIDAADLKKYEKTNVYEKGKKDPFAAVSEEPTDSNTTTNNSDGSSSSTGSTGFYEDDGTK